MLILSHVQATVERGFFTNKQMEIDNLSENTFVAQRVVFDHIQPVDGIFNVNLNKDLLFCSSSRARYQTYLDECTKKEEVAKKRKADDDELAALNAKKCHLEEQISALHKSANVFSSQAEKALFSAYH